MSRKRKKPRSVNDNGQGRGADLDLQQGYHRACALAANGEHEAARLAYQSLTPRCSDARFKAMIVNDIAAIRAAQGGLVEAWKGFQEALQTDNECEVARTNSALLAQVYAEAACANCAAVGTTSIPAEPSRRTRVAILSFLFNWPSTGGGIIHTVELATFLTRAGYDVRHVFARFEAWDIGNVKQQYPVCHEMLEFDKNEWNIPTIQSRYHAAVSAFDPDHVIITDSWNMKAVLAEAVRSYPYILRLQAMECLCPLNNLRLLADAQGGFRQCDLHQLATPEQCRSCVVRHGQQSGSLHQAERALSQVGSATYEAGLRQAFHEAEAVLVVNPLTEAMISPFAQAVKVVTAGMDPDRFPWPKSNLGKRADRKSQLFFAGIVEEPIKGFSVLLKACDSLWRRRQDFELVATGQPIGRFNDYTRFVGWLSQAELAAHMREADIVVVPTIAQEALGRTAVEAMASGVAVVASRLGGLPFTVIDGATGLLSAPGSAEDLADKIARLLDDPDLRMRLALAGRRRFEEHYSWNVIIERHYKPLLGPPVVP
jgi:glycosyltransferase involved in cell wall biosynthesis